MQEEKKRLRQLVQRLKKQLSDQEKNNQTENIFCTLEQNKKFDNARVIVLYWSIQDEVSTQNFIEKWKNKKTILLPVVRGNDLDFRIYNGSKSMVMGEFGIAEPSGSTFTRLQDIDLVIVPGLAFDIQNNRMGRGRGFYDRFLSQSKAYKIGICYSCQLFAKVPCEKHDIKMDKLISG